VSKWANEGGYFGGTRTYLALRIDQNNRLVWVSLSGFVELALLLDVVLHLFVEAFSAGRVDVGKQAAVLSDVMAEEG
jgi:hypothetical protein